MCLTISLFWLKFHSHVCNYTVTRSRCFFDLWRRLLHCGAVVYTGSVVAMQCCIMIETNFCRTRSKPQDPEPRPTRGVQDQDRDGDDTTRPMANFHSGVYSLRSPGDGSSPLGSRGEPRYGIWKRSLQKLKQFADIVCMFWLQKRSEFENFAQFTSWFLTSMFHDKEAKRLFVSPQARVWHRRCTRRHHFKMKCVFICQTKRWVYWAKKQ